MDLHFGFASPPRLDLRGGSLGCDWCLLKPTHLQPSIYAALHNFSTLGLKNGFSGHRGLTESRGQPVHVAACCRPAAPRLKRRPAAKGPRRPRGPKRCHGPFGPTAPRGHRPAAGRAPTNVILAQGRGRRGRRGRRRANLSASRAARADPLLDEDGARVVDRPRAGRETREGESPARPPPGGGLSRDGLLRRRASANRFEASRRVGASAGAPVWRSFARPSRARRRMSPHARRRRLGRKLTTPRAFRRRVLAPSGASAGVL